jgi:threonine/homoserine/homoserine lactone efflux protein
LSLSTLFITGWVIGILIAAPVGPIAILCARRTLRRGWPIGAWTGMGAATADLIGSTLVALGLGAIVSFLNDHAAAMRVAGGLFLIGFGLHTILSRKPLKPAPGVIETGWRTAFATGCILTLSNPLTFVGIVGVLAGAGVDGAIHERERLAALTLGIFTGSLLWWLMLTGAVAWFRERIGERSFALINRFAGAILIAAGLYALTLAEGLKLAR